MAIRLDRASIAAARRCVDSWSFCVGAALVALLLAGCSSVSARKIVSLDRFQRIYVEQRLSDNHRLDELIVSELRRIGREASSGPRTMMPANTDAVLTYTDRWKWDFRDYLIEATIELHTPHTQKKLADARYHQPSLTTKSPAEVARELVSEMFAK